MDALVDTFDGPLWMNRSPDSGNGINDRISVQHVDELDCSLLLINPEELMISVAIEGAAFNNAKRKVRAQFQLNGCQYKLAVTDPCIEQEFLKKGIGQYPIKSDPIYICVSISEPYKGYCYKLAASIIRP